MILGPNGKPVRPEGTAVLPPPAEPEDKRRLVRVIGKEGEPPKLMEVSKSEYNKYLRAIAFKHVEARYPELSNNKKKAMVDRIVVDPRFKAEVRRATIG